MLSLGFGQIKSWATQLDTVRPPSVLRCFQSWLQTSQPCCLAGGKTAVFGPGNPQPLLIGHAEDFEKAELRLAMWNSTRALVDMYDNQGFRIEEGTIAGSIGPKPVIYGWLPAHNAAGYYAEASGTHAEPPAFRNFGIG